MKTRFLSPRAIVSMALVPAGFVIGCSQDGPDPTGVTVALAVVGGADRGGRPLVTAMTQELTTVPIWEGDPDGSGAALITLNHGRAEVCWELSVSNLTLPATASHIHQADPGVRGPIVLPLSAPDATGQASGCASGVGRELIRAILVSPESYYVNVHTADFPPGAVRGQLPRGN